MISKVGCTILLMASAMIAQNMMAQTQLMPGTLATAVATESEFNGAASSSSDAPRPITAKERIAWVVNGTIGPASLVGGVISAGWGTAFNSPKEYGTHWEGFGERY